MYCSRLVLSSVPSQPRKERERLEEAYITVSIVTCSIVPEDAARNCSNDLLKDALKHEQDEIALKEDHFFLILHLKVLLRSSYLKLDSSLSKMLKRHFALGQKSK